jgi:hypothetical protein
MLHFNASQNFTLFPLLLQPLLLQIGSSVPFSKSNVLLLFLLLCSILKTICNGIVFCSVSLNVAANGIAENKGLIKLLRTDADVEA